MKKLINSIKNKFNYAVISAKTAIESTSGEGYIDTGVKIIIGVVIGGVLWQRSHMEDIYCRYL